MKHHLIGKLRQRLAADLAIPEWVNFIDDESVVYTGLNGVVDQLQPEASLHWWVARKFCPATASWSVEEVEQAWTVIRLNKVPLDNTGLRVWPINCRYQRGYDLVGIGHWEFERRIRDQRLWLQDGRDKVPSRSLSDSLKTHEETAEVRKGVDQSPPIPELPQEQSGRLAQERAVAEVAQLPRRDHDRIRQR